MGRYRINGLYLDEIAGFVPDSSRVSSNSFERPNDPKPVQSYDWGDENGVEYSIATNRPKKARLFTIQGVIHASSQSQYVAYKSALTSALSGLLILHAEEVDVTVNAIFRGFTEWERMTPIVGSDSIITKVGLEFDEVFNYTIYGKGKTMEYTLGNYAQMVAMIPFELPGVLYEYSIRHDEVNNSGNPSKYMRSDGDFVLIGSTDADNIKYLKRVVQTHAEMNDFLAEDDPGVAVEYTVLSDEQNDGDTTFYVHYNNKLFVTVNYEE